MDVYRYVCVCMYIHTYTHALSRTHTHTLTHIHADPDIVHVEDRVDPVDDIEIISNELRQKDLEAIERKLADLNRDKTRYTQIYESGSRPPPPWVARLECLDWSDSLYGVALVSKID